MAKLSKGDNSTSEVHHDVWSRFERAVDVVAKSPPQHRTKSKPAASRKIEVRKKGKTSKEG
jgi:hypothetical protein